MPNPRYANFVAVDPFIGVVSPATQTDSVRQWPLGMRVRFDDRGTGNSSVYRGAAEFVYCQGSNVSSDGRLVNISNNSAVLLATANSNLHGLPIGVAAAALSATNVFGWVQVQGICDYLRMSNSACATGVPLYNVSTPGVALSDTAAGQKIHGLFVLESYTSADTFALVVLNYPQRVIITGATNLLSVGGI
jgi:hypothetical protein